jgi:hypothetical protein
MKSIEQFSGPPPIFIMHERSSIIKQKPLCEVVLQQGCEDSSTSREWGRSGSAGMATRTASNGSGSVLRPRIRSARPFGNSIERSYNMEETQECKFPECCNCVVCQALSEDYRHTLIDIAYAARSLRRFFYSRTIQHPVLVETLRELIHAIAISIQSPDKPEPQIPLTLTKCAAHCRNCDAVYRYTTPRRSYFDAITTDTMIYSCPACSKYWEKTAGVDWRTHIGLHDALADAEKSANRLAHKIADGLKSVKGLTSEPIKFCGKEFHDARNVTWDCLYPKGHTGPCSWEYVQQMETKVQQRDDQISDLRAEKEQLEQRIRMIVTDLKYQAGTMEQYADRLIGKEAGNDQKSDN